MGAELRSTPLQSPSSRGGGPQSSLPKPHGQPAHQPPSELREVASEGQVLSHALREGSGENCQQGSSTESSRKHHELHLHNLSTQGRNIQFSSSGQFKDIEGGSPPQAFRDEGWWGTGSRRSVLTEVQKYSRGRFKSPWQKMEGLGRGV